MHLFKRPFVLHTLVCGIQNKINGKCATDHGVEDFKINTRMKKTLLLFFLIQKVCICQTNNKEISIEGTWLNSNIENAFSAPFILDNIYNTCEPFRTIEIIKKDNRYYFHIEFDFQMKKNTEVKLVEKKINSLVFETVKPVIFASFTISLDSLLRAKYNNHTIYKFNFSDSNLTVFAKKHNKTYEFKKYSIKLGNFIFSKYTQKIQNIINGSYLVNVGSKKYEIIITNGILSKNNLFDNIEILDVYSFILDSNNKLWIPINIITKNQKILQLAFNPNKTDTLCFFNYELVNKKNIKNLKTGNQNKIITPKELVIKMLKK